MEKKELSLHLLVQEGQVNEVRLLLKKVRSLDLADENGQTPLHVAAKTGQDTMTELLIDHGASPNCQDSEGMAPLMVAAVHGKVKIVEILLDTKSKHQKAKEQNVEVTQNKMELTTCLDRLKPNVMRADTQINRQFDINPQMTFGSRLEMNLTQVFLPEADMAIANHGKKNITANSACFGQQSGKFWGVNPSCKETPTKERQTHVMVDVNQQSLNGRTALYYAAARGHAPIVELLLLHGADVNVPDNYGDTPLRMAVEESSWATVNLLLDHGADPDIRYRGSLTSFSTVVLSKIGGYRKRSEEQETFARRLLHHGADIRSLAGGGEISSPLLPIQYDPRALCAALEYELVTDFDWLRELSRRISDYELADNRNLFDGGESGKVLVEYVSKIKAARILSTQISNKDLEDFSSRNFTTPSENYEREVSKMDCVIGGSSTTFLELLAKSTDQLARLVRNDSLVQSLEAAVSGFPLYTGILRGRLEKGLSRRGMLDTACRICHLMFNHSCRVPYEVTERVIINLDDRELRRFVSDHARDPFWKRLM